VVFKQAVKDAVTSVLKGVISILKGVIAELLPQAVRDILSGIFNSVTPQAPKKVRIPWWCLQKMKELELTTEDIVDAFWHGENGKTKYGAPKVTKKYTEYIIGMTYRIDDSGDYQITKVWKDQRT